MALKRFYALYMRLFWTHLFKHTSVYITSGSTIYSTCAFCGHGAY